MPAEPVVQPPRVIRHEGQVAFMTCIGKGADIWTRAVVARGEDQDGARIWMAREGTAQALHIGRVGDLEVIVKDRLDVERGAPLSTKPAKADL